jgi:hypothetical protein
MTALLAALGVKAETINTGGNGWSSFIALTKHARLELNDFSGEWSWTLYQHGGEQLLCGHWGSANDVTVATKHQGSYRRDGLDRRLTRLSRTQHPPRGPAQQPGRSPVLAGIHVAI